MVTLTPGKALRSKTPSVTIENQLDIGTWRFQLTVVDDDKNESAPAVLAVNVVARRVIGGGLTPVPAPVLVSDPVRVTPAPSPAPIRTPVREDVTPRLASTPTPAPKPAPAPRPSRATTTPTPPTRPVKPARTK